MKFQGIWELCVMKCEQIQNAVTEGAAIPRYYLGNDKGFRSSVPGTGMETKYILLSINHNITVALGN